MGPANAHQSPFSNSSYSLLGSWKSVGQGKDGNGDVVDPERHELE